MPPRELNDATPTLPDHRHGHRERLRLRLREGGVDAMPDYELLELLLCLAVPRRDMKPLAKTLLEEFGHDWARLLAAPRAHLTRIGGVGEGVADALAIVAATVSRAQKPDHVERANMSSWQAAVAYCQGQLAGLGVEQFRVLFLDRKNKLIRDQKMSEGTVDHAPVYVREVIRRALELQASALILVHNHPSGDPAPSSADVEITKLIIDAARAMDISVHDHLIIGRNGHKSLRQMGLL